MMKTIVKTTGCLAATRRMPAIFLAEHRSKGARKAPNPLISWANLVGSTPEKAQGRIAFQNRGLALKRPCWKPGKFVVEFDEPLAGIGFSPAQQSMEGNLLLFSWARDLVERMKDEEEQ